MTAAALPPWPLPRWIAHRGAGKLAPENTLAAFREGARHGYTAFECDVKLSRDDVAFLMHDAELARTTGEAGVAGDRAWAELSRLDAGSWHGRAHAGEPLPTLEAVARYLRRNGYALDLEIKPTPKHEAHTGRLVALEVARLWAGAPTPPLLSSFWPQALAGAREGDPSLPRALLLDRFWDGWFEMARQLGCVGVITSFEMMDGPLFEKLRGAGLRAAAYTVNDAEEARRLIALGVDSIVTDAVDAFSPAAEFALPGPLSSLP
jgi:glycerophosphoryl diester phosphodiesterase